MNEHVVRRHTFEKKPKRNKRSITWLLIAIVSFLLTCGLLYFFTPNQKVVSILPQFTTMAIFFLLLGSTLFSLGTYVFKNKAHGTLIAVFVLSCFFFLLQDLRHPFFFIMLFALFLTLELFVSYRK